MLDTDRTRTRALACVLAAALLLPHTMVQASQPTESPAWSAVRLNTRVTEAEARDLKRQSDIRRAELAYLYSVPAFLHLKQRHEWVRNFTTYMGDRGNPFGQFLLLRQPTSPRTQDTLPNYDTLYGATYLDLSLSPVVVSVPDVPERYFSLALVDAYFYNFAYVGSRTTGQKGGNYLLVGPGWEGKVPAGIRDVIRAPTHSMHIYQRIYFRDPADIPAVHAIQDKIRVTPLARFLNPAAQAMVPDPAQVLKVDPAAATDPVAMMAMTNAYTGLNPPPPNDQAMLEHIAPLGVGPGLSMPAGPAARDILLQGAKLADQTLSALALEGSREVHGWQIPPANVAQRGGAGMAFHAMQQIRSIGINIPAEAVYYLALKDADGQPLNGARRYTLTFQADQLPPVRKDRFGFWSLTMYHRDNYLLVDNPANKYAVRSGDALVLNPDGSLTLTVQAERPAEGTLTNWLPAPAKGDFVLALRVYVGGPDVVAGTWTPAPLRVRD